MIIRAIAVVILAMPFCVGSVCGDDAAFLSAQEMAATIGGNVSEGGVTLMYDDICYFCQDTNDTSCQEVCTYVVGGGGPPDHHCTQVKHVEDFNWTPSQCAESFSGWKEADCSDPPTICAKEYTGTPILLTLDPEPQWGCTRGVVECGSLPIWQRDIKVKHCTVTNPEDPNCSTGMMGRLWPGLTRYRHG